MKEIERKKKLESKLQEFSAYLISNNTNAKINLISGSAGEILFLCYYSNYFKDETSLSEIYIRLEKIVNNINVGNDYAPFAGGVCGITWLLEHLVNEGFIEYDLEGLYEDTDEYLNEHMIYYMNNGDYDYLHAALGIANYFLNRNTSKTNNYLLHFINLLASNSIIDKQQETISFKSLITNTGNPFLAFNFSLSHGMASIIYFLQRCLLHEHFKNNNKVNDLILGLQNFYFKNQNDIRAYNSYFPSWIGETNIKRNSRIAWCYGDLGVGITFLNCGINHSKNEISEYGINVLMKTLNRKDLDKENIVDAGICHGSSGLALIYDRAYNLTKKNAFLKASNYWIDISLNLSTHADGICGYKAYLGTEIDFVNETGFLEGISGIGLVFLSKLDRSKRNWEKAFMIS